MFSPHSGNRQKVFKQNRNAKISKAQTYAVVTKYQDVIHGFWPRKNPSEQEELQGISQGKSLFFFKQIKTVSLRSSSRQVLAKNSTSENSHACFCHLTFSKSCSLWKDSTWEPTTGAQVLSVNTLRIKGSGSPCLITMLAIWITGSFSASGNTPGRKQNTLIFFFFFCVPSYSSEVHLFWGGWGAGAENFLYMTV